MKTCLINIAAIGCLAAVAEGKALKWGFAVDARSYTPPQETLGVMFDVAGGISPAPTQAPDPVRVDVRKRAVTQADNTCGYISGLAAEPLYCNTDSVCVYNSVRSNIGCCPSSQSTSCSIWTTCLDSSRGAQFTTDNGLTMWCGLSAYPYCVTHIYHDKAFTGYSLFGCAAAPGTDTVFYTPLSASEFTGGQPSLSVTRTSAGFIPSAPAATVTVVASSTGSASGSSSGSGGAPIGAIVGGAVGGVAILAAAVFAIVFCMRRKGKKDPDAAATAPGPNGPGPSPGAMPPMHQQQNGFYPPTASSYDGRSSMAKPGYDVSGAAYDANGSPISPPPQQPPSPTPYGVAATPNAMYHQQQQQQQQYPYGSEQQQPLLQPGQYPNSPTSAYSGAASSSLSAREAGNTSSFYAYGNLSPNHTGGTSSPPQQQPQMQTVPQHYPAAHELPPETRQHFTAELDATRKEEEPRELAG